MIHYFIKWVQSTMIIVRNTSKHILSGMDETQISKHQRCNEEFCPQATGCHPRYRLPRYSLAYHTS
jgi:hypothetical protein